MLRRCGSLDCVEIVIVVWFISGDWIHCVARLYILICVGGFGEFGDDRLYLVVLSFSSGSDNRVT